MTYTEGDLVLPKILSSSFWARLDSNYSLLHRRDVRNHFLGREHQELVGKNICMVKAPFMIYPTGGGKTLSFWHPLSYHWDSKDAILTSQRVINPFNAPMKSQAKALQDGYSSTCCELRGWWHGMCIISVYLSCRSFLIAVILETEDTDSALSRRRWLSQFHEKVLKNKVSRANCRTHHR